MSEMRTYCNHSFASLEFQALNKLMSSNATFHFVLPLDLSSIYNIKILIVVLFVFKRIMLKL